MKIPNYEQEILIEHVSKNGFCLINKVTGHLGIVWSAKELTSWLFCRTSGGVLQRDKTGYF